MRNIANICNVRKYIYQVRIYCQVIARIRNIYRRRITHHRHRLIRINNITRRRSRTTTIRSTHKYSIAARHQSNSCLQYARSRIISKIRYPRAVNRQIDIFRTRYLRNIHPYRRYRTLCAVRTVGKAKSHARRSYHHIRIYIRIVIDIAIGIDSRPTTIQIKMQKQIRIVMYVVPTASRRTETIEIVAKRPRYPMPNTNRKTRRYPIPQLKTRMRHKTRIESLRYISLINIITHRINTTSYCRSRTRTIDIFIAVQIWVN